MKRKIILFLIFVIVCFILTVLIINKSAIPQAASDPETVSAENQLYYETLQSGFAQEHDGDSPVASTITPYIQDSAAYTFYSPEERLYYVLIDLYVSDTDSLRGKDYIFLTLDQDFYWTSDHCSVSLWTRGDEGGPYVKARDLATADSPTQCQVYISELEDVSAPFHIQFRFEAPWKNDAQIEQISYQYGIR